MGGGDQIRTKNENLSNSNTFALEQFQKSFSRQEGG